MLPEWFDLLGLMAWPLLVCAILGLAVIFERLVFVVRMTVGQASRLQYLLAKLEEHQSQPKALRDEYISLLIGDLRRPYFNGIATLRIIAAISPLLGLLGTILGIIAAFKLIAAQTGPVSPNMLADGLWEAMLTTAAGLMIAIPALLLAHVFQHSARHQLDKFCARLNKVSMSYESDEPAIAARPAIAATQQTPVTA